MPAKPNHTGTSGVPSTKGIGSVRTFSDGIIPYFPERNFTISGVTRDATGGALANCLVDLFNTATDVREQSTISDASGVYSFIVDKTQFWYVVAYLDGAPDLAGTSVNTLAGA